MTEDSHDYRRMAQAIEWLAEHALAQPGLDDAAAAAGLSPAHFQKMFSRWVGVSPKRFLQVLTVARGRELLSAQAPVLAVADDTGLSSGSRLHDHFVALEAATPGEFGTGGSGLDLRWGTGHSPFGPVLVAWTPRGICRLTFIDSAGPSPESDGIQALRDAWPAALPVRDDNEAARRVERIFGTRRERDGPLSLHVRGTNFQVAVWRALLAIPPGAVSSYATLARTIGQPTAARAIGNAVGANPVAFVIPCHRVIRGSGALGGYRWGLPRKRAMFSWEQARLPG